ncbi:pyridoxal-phosphate dependent enzyme [Sporosarcina sp. FSL K6-3457]|uniref:pyridoxal-phosphate dependent enzyme n=1 Tax=Sporosarcina sp. FSL K6-3457 TaxID=2978204 RepID=UPI0030FA45E6
MLPYKDFPTIGEGNTPMIQVKNLCEELGLKNLWIKNEGQNPTGSHKDRMSPLIIARAKSIGMESVAVASSGNAGASIAAYAAAGDVECIVLTTESMNPIWKQAIEKTGATIVYTKEAMKRWELMKGNVENGIWYPATNFINPPVGSNPFGVQGYKTIAYEIIEDSEEIPNIIIVPCSRGDLLWGIWEGFKEVFDAGMIHSLPRLIAVEPFPRLKKVLEGQPYVDSFIGDSTYTPSVGGITVTYQALKAIQESNGEVVVIPSHQAETEQKHLGKHGIYAERSSSLVVGALKYLIKKQAIQEEDKILLLISSNGYKELF